MKLRSVVAAIPLLLLLVALVLVAGCSAGDQQDPRLASLIELKNDTNLLSSNDTEVLLALTNFTGISEQTYSQITSLEVNHMTALATIDLAALIDKFSILMSQLSEYHGDHKEELKTDTTAVLEDINATLYTKISELLKDKEEIENEQSGITQEYMNLTTELSVLNNYSLVISERRELEEQLNTSQISLEKDTIIYFITAILCGALVGFLFFISLKRRQKFLELFTRAREKRPVFIALAVSITLTALAVYLGITYDIFWFW